jgi:hypothetical protein
MLGVTLFEMLNDVEETEPLPPEQPYVQVTYARAVVAVHLTVNVEVPWPAIIVPPPATLHERLKQVPGALNWKVLNTSTHGVPDVRVTVY